VIRALVTGCRGQVGSELLRALDGRAEVIARDRGSLDLGDADAIRRCLRDERPQLIVNAGAYTAVDKAETDLDAARAVNARAPGILAEEAKRQGAVLVHFSTDYVFDGGKGAPYLEEDATAPLSVYGASKLSGERMALAACPRTLVLRTSWVISAYGKNFVKTMLRIAREGAPLRVVDDQFGRPTAAADLAAFVLAQAPRLAAAPAGAPVFGLFHFANAGETSWRGLAQATVEIGLGPDAPAVAPIATAERPSPARRPLRATLDTSKLEAVFGWRPRPWRDALGEIVAELAKAEAPAR